MKRGCSWFLNAKKHILHVSDPRSMVILWVASSRYVCVRARMHACVRVCVVQGIAGGQIKIKAGSEGSAL